MILDTLPSGPRMPVLFIGHGSPMNALEDNPFTRSLTALAKSIEPAPSAILVVSAHWYTRGTFVQESPRPATIHDFGGFPEELFRITYPAPGAPTLARATAELVPPATTTEEWGLDHGAWTILRHLYPAAAIPVYQLSIDGTKPATYHYELGRQLRRLREKSVLIVGSGNIVHNLRVSIPKLMMHEPAPMPWAVEFDAWVSSKLQDRDFPALAHFEVTGESGKLSVPTPDHYLPLLYTAGAAETSEPLVTSYEEVCYGGISMRSFRIG